MAALAVAQGVGSFLEAKQKAAQDEAKFQQNRINATQARDLQIGALRNAMLQQSEATSGQKLALRIQALETAESQLVAGGESGFGGKSIEDQIKMTDARKERGLTALNDQDKAYLRQMDYTALGLEATTMNRINSMPRGQEPNALMAVISTASSAYGANLKYGGAEKTAIDFMGDFKQVLPTVPSFDEFGVSSNVSLPM
ncbi:hypothetical protein N9008_00120 [bacterium]|nr:hypothetical protein [bacterium]